MSKYKISNTMDFTNAVPLTDYHLNDIMVRRRRSKSNYYERMMKIHKHYLKNSMNGNKFVLLEALYNVHTKQGSHREVLYEMIEYD